MPRNRTLSGRVERNRNRNAIRLTRRHINNVVELKDSYKCALNPVPPNFESFYLGEMDKICTLCGAKHFKSEITMRGNDKFTLCCHKGKVFLPPLTQNPYFRSLCEGIVSSDASIKQKSQNYLNNIRSYNAAYSR